MVCAAPWSNPLISQPTPITERDLVAIGVITRTQGHRGALRLMPFFEPLERFDGLRGDELILELPHRVAEAFRVPEGTALPPAFRALRIRSHSYHQQFVILELAEVPDMTAAEKLRGARVLVRPSSIWQLGDGEYFIHELVGFTLVDAATGAPLGTVKDVRTGGAQDMLVVERETGRVFPVPFVRPIVVQVEPAQRRIIADLPPGIDEL